MPCTAKKAEILRPESKTGGDQDIDYSLTTSELLEIMEARGLNAQDCKPRGADLPFSIGSGSGTLFGVTGGVTEAVLRYLSPKLGFESLDWIKSSGVRGFDGIKMTTIESNETRIRAAIVSGLGNADQLLQKIESGDERFDIIEVMACPGGCVMGGGQPSDIYDILKNRSQRSDVLYNTDGICQIKTAQDNTQVNEIYHTLIKGRAHELLHRNRSHPITVSQGELYE
jgi:NADH-quinone oxidoreductase subunit G